MAESRNHYSIIDMKKFTFEVLVKGGYSEEAAQATTDALLHADIRGIYSHGIAGGTGSRVDAGRTIKRVPHDPFLWCRA